MSVETLLELSAVHIKPATDIWLQEHVDDIKNPFSYYQLTYGWLFDLSAEDLEGETATSIPEDLMGCIRESLKEECRWMILDADAPEWKPLPAFREEWDKMGYFRIAEELSIKDGI